ncbi:MAG: NADH-ubiquinone oxidoreductase-F iron-sulfur binding region domain-containing protein [Rhodospirillales bacterium]|nr:NADH-ubiquinone oxidoreductase-F iron-sulfur binding region domain-containing protein [Rhodospirillales bacterium]
MADMSEIEKRFDIHEIAKNKNQDLDRYQCNIYCCHSTGCKSSGSDEILDLMQKAIEEHELQGKVRIVATGCMGLCAQGPLIRVEIKGQKDVLYKRVEPLISRIIITEHVVPALKLEPGQEFTLPDFLQKYVLSLDLPFFKKQEKVVLKMAGHLDPEDIQEYIANGGYLALEKVLKTMTPQQVIEEIKKSGLRGRGGAGFSTGMKWEFASKVKAVDDKFIICNGDEGDPGAYMDRSILESNPHSVIEGMMIAAYAIGATEGWFYIRAEYPLAVERIEKAIKACKKNRLLGNNIMGTNFSFNIDIRLGAGAFVCGEETALIHSIEGNRGTPRPRPPYPTDKGLWGKPSCINNVETLANISSIIIKGADWFSSFGTATSKGTKVFALTGQVEHSGLIEVPMGTSINEIVNEIGGGVPNGKKLKAVQTGGPSGGVIPTEYINLPLCYDELKKVGSIMGSGGMIVIDDSSDMVDLAKFYLDFTVDESCGKCAPCRIGGKQMLLLLEKISKGRGTKEDIAQLRQIATAMQKASLCGLGQTAPNPVLSTLHFFGEEYEAKVAKK